MKLIDNLKIQLTRIGATLDPDCDYTLNCDAPKGYVWRANGCTCISIHYATNRQSWLAKALQDDGLPRLKMGLEKVTDIEQLNAIQHDLGDDNWKADDNAPNIINWD